MSIKYTGSNVITYLLNKIKDKFYSKTETDDKIHVVGMLASEGDFKAEALSRHVKHGFDYICIETFEDCDDIDSTLENGATVIAQCWDEDAHIIRKTDSGTYTIVSKKFEVDSIPYDILVLADWDGTGSVSLQVSKNNGSNWFDVANDTLVHLNSLVQKDIRVKITMTGQVRLKNIAWGFK